MVYTFRGRRDYWVPPCRGAAEPHLIDTKKHLKLVILSVCFTKYQRETLIKGFLLLRDSLVSNLCLKMWSGFGFENDDGV